MLRTILIAALLSLISMTASAADGLIVKPSNYSVSETIDRLQAALEEKGLTIFARIDHEAGASSAGLELAPTQVLIFGNPKLGTPLMTSSPTTAIDLPQKALAYQDADGQVHLAYNDIDYLVARHGISERDDVVEKIRGALGKLTDVTTQ